MSRPAPFEPNELLHHREWVGRLARRLCRDEHTAEDSVQTVFTQALRHPPPHRHNLRGWLAQLLRNTLGMHRRAAMRRCHREQAVAEDAVARHSEAAADAVLRTEAHRRLVDLVLQLPEPQRGLVLRHYFEDAPVADLAAQSGISADAVRAHLRRARERLRHELERSDARQRRAFALLTGTGGTGGEAVAAAAIAGGLLMTTMLKIGCAALAAAAALLWWSPWVDVPIPITAEVVADAPATTVTSSAVHDPAVRGAPAERHAQTLPARPAAMALTAELVGLVDGMRWQPPLVIRAKGKVDDGWQEHEAVAVAEPTGAFSFELPGWAREATTLELQVGPRRSDPNYDCEGARFDKDAMLVRKPLFVPVTVIAQLTGRVVDESGMGVPAARVCAYRAADALPNGAVLAQCNTDGAGYYTLRTPAEGDLALIALPMEPAQLSGMRLQLENGAIMDAGKPRTDLLPIGVLARTRFGRPDAAPEHRLPPASQVKVTIALPAGLPAEAARLSVRFPEKPRELNIQSMQRLVVWSLDRCAMVSAWPQLEPSEQTLRVPAGVRVQLRPMALHTAVLSCCVEPATEVVAPASCTLTFTGSPRTLVVLQGGVPLAGVPVRTVVDEMRYRSKTDAEGRCQVLMGPSPVSITVQAIGTDPVTVTMGP
ncbi:MAG: sigma-70 family RNA polymerase sigma factor, partial [Planctomycetes bacterium]|nr:sigma-70 family RNA polymerase sigma factor [Planctomycetota bacterium]